MTTIAFQPEFRPELPVVFGAKDYREFRSTIEEMDRILTATDLEHRMIGGSQGRTNITLCNHSHLPLNNILFLPYGSFFGIKNSAIAS